ncbi:MULTISPECIES: flagellar biosynthesis anti-sigma factor FlgM [Vibrio]|uniref:Negative regulator of flagellin synthesis n=1 Tax=Vibrio diazotrophicus TaxID=685 RepID=A0A329EAX1_VIBDI|nr:flagellar biosynthesis anti-sigma factor FlgM [Vibrio diazotrophicus]PNI00114.1 flagellar biosynthesis anti-sigma factor FlgM [Vibrio diazotrophicus]RAS57023.1 FlgM family anti-sigma-28 factor [Vibrio diazotrophicus]
MKIENNSALYSVQDVQNVSRTAELNKAHSVAPAKQQVDINMHEQNIIAEGSASLKAMDDVDLARVADIKSQIADGSIKFDMGELAQVLANLR